jgi:hypothetical protein
MNKEAIDKLRQSLSPDIDWSSIEQQSAEIGTRRELAGGKGGYELAPPFGGQRMTVSHAGQSLGPRISPQE